GYSCKAVARFSRHCLSNPHPTAIGCDCHGRNVASTSSDFRNQVPNHPPVLARDDEPFPDPQLEPREDDSRIRVWKRGLLNHDNLVQVVIFESSELENTQSCSTSCC